MKADRAIVGDVLTLRRRTAEVKVDGVYNEIGIRSFGRGVFHKEPVSGAQLGAKRVFRIEPGDLLLSNVFAWEGAITVASQAEKGRIGSHRFMTYVSTDGLIDTAWASWYFRSEQGLELIRQASPGSAGRNRTLAIDRFEALEIPLPPMDEQRRVAAKLDRVFDVSVEATRRLGASSRLGLALTHSQESRLLADIVTDGVPMKPLGEVTEINPKPTRLSVDEVVAFVPMAAVSAAKGTIEDPTLRTVGGVGRGFKQFRRGDVIFARITPCMQNGKTAIFDAEEFGLGSTEFHVIRPGPELTAEWVHRILRNQEFRDRAAEHFKGTAGQQRVPADFLRNVMVPVPSLGEQPKVIERLDGIARTRRSFGDHNEKSTKLLKALVPATLNAAFAHLV